MEINLIVKTQLKKYIYFTLKAFYKIYNYYYEII